MKIQPLLLPALVDPVPAYQAAPPVAFDRRMLKKLTLTTPLDFERLCCVVLLDPIFNWTLALIPLMVKSSKRNVSPDPKLIVNDVTTAGSLIRSANLLFVPVNKYVPPALNLIFG